MGSEVFANKAGPAPSSAQSLTSPRTSTAYCSVWKSSTLVCRAVVLVAIISFYVAFDTICNMTTEDAGLSQHGKTIFVPFVFKFSSKHVPQVMCTIEGVDIKMPVDTGSTGLLIGAPILPSIDPNIGEPAHHFFTSSKILYVGRLVDLPVRFGGEHGSYAKANVPVLVVDKSWRCPWYNPGKDSFKCPPGPNGESATQRDTSNITYMGVGFGRNCPKDGMPIATPQVNPFLNIDTIDDSPVYPKTMRAGYIVTTKGIHLGLTSHNLQGFVFENLRPGLAHDKDARDWSMSRMCFSINSAGTNCGAMLVDTGIAQMYIRPKEGEQIPTVTIRNPNPRGHAKMVKRVRRGTKIDVAFPTFDDEKISYSFVVGEGSPVEPNFVVPAQGTTAPFINTGRNFLYGHSIAFDAIGGRFGLRPVHPSASSRKTVFRFLCTHVSASGIVPGRDGEWKSVV
ncbi:hypothetical protein DE146DRAFT_621153 [Phaeosphaeria sp. MPI-PUGE-AT-0046c]|nr:hypothetical protein DE146DRAFT_621153 [Phaeosphaeria sp. MPI-PUGE-AT-0046c]